MRPRQLVAINNMKAKLNGMSVAGPHDPPTYQSTPWNTITVGIMYSPSSSVARATLSVDRLASDIRAQLGIAGATGLPNLELRIQKLNFWAQNESVTTPCRFNADVYDIAYGTTSDNNTRILSSLTDVGAKNHYAHSAYIYPITQQNIPLNQDTASYIFGCDLTANESLIVYIRCLWRFQPPASAAPDLPRELLC